MRGPPPAAGGGTRPSPGWRGVQWVSRHLDGALLLLLGWWARWGPRRVRPGTGTVFITDNLAVGGAQRQLVALLAGGAARWRGVRVVLLSARGALVERVAGLGVAVEVVEERLRAEGREALLTLLPRTAYLGALHSRLRQLRPQLVWSWLSLPNVVAAPAARLAGVPRVVTTVRGNAVWEFLPGERAWWMRPATRTATALADTVVANAEAVAQDCRLTTGCPPERIRVIRNGLDAAEVNAVGAGGGAGAVGKGEGGPVVLSVGRLSREKGHELLLRASAALGREGVEHRLVLVGGGDEETVLRRRAAELGIAPRVVFAGETLAVAGYYRAADVFALPSAVEGLPNVLLEAGLFALPAVTTAAGGAAEVVVHGETGLVVPVGDEGAFAAALGRLLADPDLRRRMGEAGRRRVLREFSLPRMVREMGGLARQLGVDTGGVGPP